MKLEPAKGVNVYSMYDSFVEHICEKLDKYTHQNWDQNPFGHLVIDNFLPSEVIQAMLKSLNDFVEKSRSDWRIYENPLERKALLNDYSKFPNEVYSYFLALGSPAVTVRMAAISGIDNLVPDSGLHGGGVHLHTRGGKLNVHQDYSLHPRTGLQRRLNIILYLNPEWDPSWGGGLGLYSEDVTLEQPDELVKEISCLFNRAVIFDTAPGSWHGLPDPILCPEDRMRLSLAYYYTRTPVPNAPKRGAVRFAPTKEQQGDKEIADLIIKRSNPQTAHEVYRKS